MRLAFISYEYHPEIIGGIGTYVRHAVEMLAVRGHEIDVFAGTSAETPREESSSGGRVHRLPCINRFEFSTTAVAALAVQHSIKPYDLVEVPDLYAEGRGLRTQLPDLPIVLRAHTPLYIPSKIDFQAIPLRTRLLSGLRRFSGALSHGAAPGTAWNAALARVNFRFLPDLRHDAERQVALEAELVVPPSHRLAGWLQASWGLPSTKVRVLPYPHLPDPSLLRLPPAGTDPVREIAFHGSIRLFKGVHVLLNAMPQVLARHPNVRLAIAGTSGISPIADNSWTAFRRDRMVVWRDTLDWLQPQLDTLGDRVIVRGFVRPELLAIHLAGAQVCVFPSLFDNFPNACLEAMSAGRAIVATRSGGMEEMVGADEAGLLVQPGHARHLAAAICGIIENSELRARLAQRARERVIAKYAPDVIGPFHEAIYREAIALRHAA